MIVLNSKRGFVLSILCLLQVEALSVIEEYNEKCDKVTKDPLFTEELVVGKKWRTYYAWDVPADNYCTNVKFKRAHSWVKAFINFIRVVELWWLHDESASSTGEYYPSTEINLVNTVQSTMRPHLVTEPNWDGATLFVKLFPHVSSSLLIPDSKGIPGQYYGVPYIMRGQDVRILEKTDVVKFAFKVLRDGQYLVFSHCSCCTFLLCRQNGNVSKPNRAEIKEIADSLDLGRGFLACKHDFM